ncbi:MAG: RnfH family protein [Burkholderiaceae bacterium]
MISALMTVTVVYCTPDVEDLSEVRLPPDSTVRDAVVASGVQARRPELNGTLDAGIWGRRRAPDQLLKDGDRVEIYRLLTIDPKEGRRVRADVRRNAGVSKRSLKT